jgi:tetraacyldisaccharide 4'-kinase
VSVCEDRALAVPRLMSEKEATSLILLDDAFQHRYIKPKVNILLTSFDQPFFRDFILPSGMLRESHYGARRADIIIVSKCPKDINENQKSRYRNKIKLFCKPGTKIYFSSFNYGAATSFDGTSATCPENVYLISGLANSKPFEEYVKSKFHVIEEKHFADHYDFYSDDVEQFVHWLDSNPSAALLCTEKDFVKLNDGRFDDLFGDRQLFYIPIEVDFGEEKERFLSDLKKRIE